jgi:hypothetical protein
VSAGNLAPNNSELGASLGNSRLGNEGNSLAQVELGRLSVIHILDIHQVGVNVRVSSSSVKQYLSTITTSLKSTAAVIYQPLVAQNSALHVKSWLHTDNMHMRLTNGKIMGHIWHSMQHWHSAIQGYLDKGKRANRIPAVQEDMRI